jgi:predicted DNA-binding transcriptional regulator YafY
MTFLAATGSLKAREDGGETSVRGGPVRYEKAETILRIALDMQGSGEGLTIDDIRIRYGDEPLSRRTAERLRDAVERVFPQMEQANPSETPKRWRIRSGTVNGLVGLSADEFVALGTAENVLKRENANAAADALGSLAAKLRAMIRPEVTRRVEPDVELLLEAEGLAMRPGPRPKVDPEIVATLRQAILASRKVRLHYQGRSTGAQSRQLVCPYGFLYGNRPYLVAYSMNSAVRDYRLFSLASIGAVDPTEFTFSRRADFSLAEFARRSFGVFQEEPFDVAWRFGGIGGRHIRSASRGINSPGGLLQSLGHRDRAELALALPAEI